MQQVGLMNCDSSRYIYIALPPSAHWSSMIVHELNCTLFVYRFILTKYGVQSTICVAVEWREVCGERKICTRNCMLRNDSSSPQKVCLHLYSGKTTCVPWLRMEGEITVLVSFKLDIPLRHPLILLSLNMATKVSVLWVSQGFCFVELINRRISLNISTNCNV